MNRPAAFAALGAIAAAWGMTIPLSKIAVSTGYQGFGLIFWQFVIGIAVLVPVALPSVKRIFRAQNLEILIVVAMIGTILPNSFSYRAAAELPAGVMAIEIAMVPMFALPIALLLRLERFSARRLGGVLLGALTVVLLVGPDSSLPDPSKSIFVFVALVAPFFYGCEGNYLNLRGNSGLKPTEIMFGSAILGLIIVTPLAIFSGQFIVPPPSFGDAEWSLTASSVLHILAYTGYVWLIGRAGAVFSSMVAYLVTGFAFVWSMLLLSEHYSMWVWAALGLMMFAIWLVQPKRTHS